MPWIAASFLEFCSKSQRAREAVGAGGGSDGGNFGGGRSSGSGPLDDDGDSDYFGVVKKRSRKNRSQEKEES